MQVECSRDDGFFVVKIPIRESYSDRNVRKFLDFLKIKQNAGKSQTSDKNIEKLSDEITGEWWRKNKDTYMQ